MIEILVQVRDCHLAQLDVPQEKLSLRPLQACSILFIPFYSVTYAQKRSAKGTKGADTSPLRQYRQIEACKTRRQDIGSKSQLSQAQIRM
jgi:hypothetical protein